MSSRKVSKRGVDAASFHTTDIGFLGIKLNDRKRL
jgi:hypothetical protein